jgi:BirA family biotin operon repressor/biotin-[acetyl-CoA-carboxylase] ligase
MITMNCEIIKKTLLKYLKNKITIKYPNDLQINKKKFCGILQEIIFNKELKFMIVGIGINLVKNPKIKNYPTTNIFIETGIKIKKLKLIKSIESNYSSKLKLFA